MKPEADGRGEMPRPREREDLPWNGEPTRDSDLVSGVGRNCNKITKYTVTIKTSNPEHCLNRALRAPK